MTAIELKNVTVYYGEVLALNDINMKVEKGQFLGVIGPNGGGKSTLLKVILGLVKPRTGYIKIFGKMLNKSKDLLGYVPQASDFDRKFPASVLDVVLMGGLKGDLELFYTYTEEDRKNAFRIMDRLGIYDLKDRQIGQLSGGQLQRVLIARALTVSPEILLLDEPTASIDADSRSKIYSILKELNKEMTIVVVTHDLAAISSYFDSVACLNEELHYHGGKDIDQETVNKVYGCPVELIAHGVPHRVLPEHGEGYDD